MEKETKFFDTLLPTHPDFQPIIQELREKYGLYEVYPDDEPIGAYRSVQLRARELRQEMTSAEKILWTRLRDYRLAGFKFRRQAPIGHFIADFYCAECRLIVEIDGEIHDLQIEQDKLRTEEMESLGYRVIRFRNEQIEKDIEFVLKSILEACRLEGESPLPRLGEAG
ncbi:MAG: endonuclease domain-containing protein [Chloroflexi bacterium]|nr:endonuclease domain-containing protein [Chloroflexota bacterium]